MPLNILKSTTRKSRPLEPPISNIKAFYNSIKEFKKTFTKASKRCKKELNSSLVLAIVTSLINVIILFNNKKLFILNLVIKLNNLLFSLIIINKQKEIEKYTRPQGFNTYFIKRMILIKALDGLGL